VQPNGAAARRVCVLGLHTVSEKTPISAVVPAKTRAAQTPHTLPKVTHGSYCGCRRDEAQRRMRVPRR
jgi:hypothetical protein